MNWSRSFYKVLFRARLSFVIGLSASLINLVIGVIYGLIAGFTSPRLDEWMVRVLDVLQSIPYVLVVILLIVIMGHG